jgi:ubiquitin-protein ligase E3 A
MVKVLAKNLTALLECEGNVEELFMCTFCVSYDDMVGGTCVYELKENGKEIPVTKENRKVRVGK